MQAFGRRIDQDQILRVIAYLEVLREEVDWFGAGPVPFNNGSSNTLTSPLV
jgi:hypothetical protein